MNPRVFRVALLALIALLAAGSRAEEKVESISILSLADGAMIPRDLAPPTFRWKDAGAHSRWRLTVEFEGGEPSVSAECNRPEWQPEKPQWEAIKSRSLGRRARLTVAAVERMASTGRASKATVSFRTSPDPVGAPIFYREVPLPVGFALDNKPLINWKVADLGSGRPPRTVLSRMQTCANCHSFSADGKSLAMDIDFGADKGAYAIADTGRDVRIGREQMITWSDFKRDDGQPTLGLLSVLAPDGRSVVSTVKDTIVLSFMPDPHCSQVFFPIRGILATYDRATRNFEALPGADDPTFVQTNPAFSPDGRWVVFARAKVPDLAPQDVMEDGGVSPRVVEEFVDGRRKIQYDLYRLPFNDGRGGKPEPLPGASRNGSSNFFARFSPDGKWIVFCQADSMMLNRPDSELYIMPANGGAPRRLRANAPGRMNSWHSFSPNGRWLVFASKANGPMTQLWLTHIDANGQDSPPILLDGLVAPDRAANLPEFLPRGAARLMEIVVADEIRNSALKVPSPVK